MVSLEQWGRALLLPSTDTLCHAYLLLPRLVYALESMLYMLSQHHAMGLQTDYMVTVLAPMVEAARLPHVRPMALG